MNQYVHPRKTPRRGWQYTHILLLRVGFLLLLAGCGGPTLPSNYVAANQNHFATMIWQQNGSDLSGSWQTWTTPDTTTAQVPAPQGVPFSGQIQDQTVMLTIEGSSLQATYQQGHLTLAGNIPNDQFQATTWYPVSQIQSDHLTTTFTTYAKLHGQLTALAQSVTHPAPDSDPYTFANTVQNAQMTVQTMQARASELQGLGNPCGTGVLALFRAELPTDAVTFTLSSYEKVTNTPSANAQAVVNHSQLATQLQTVQNAWLVAQKMNVPRITGLSYAWILSSGDEANMVHPVTSALATLQNALVTDEQTMIGLRVQAHALEQGVENLSQAHGC